MAISLTIGEGVICSTSSVIVLGLISIISASLIWVVSNSVSLGASISFGFSIFVGSSVFISFLIVSEFLFFGASIKFCFSRSFVFVFKYLLRPFTPL